MKAGATPLGATFPEIPHHKQCPAALAGLSDQPLFSWGPDHTGSWLWASKAPKLAKTLFKSTFLTWGLLSQTHTHLALLPLKTVVFDPPPLAKRAGLAPGLISQQATFPTCRINQVFHNLINGLCQCS